MSLGARCHRCETVCDSVAGPGMLHLRMPLAHTVGKVQHHLDQAASHYTKQHGTLSIAVPNVDLLPMLRALCDVLTPTEQADVRALFQPAGTSLSIHEYLGATSLPQLVAQAQSGWLVRMLRDERLHMVFQPIVSCNEPDQVFAYECLLRGTNDEQQVVYPNQLLSVARGADLLFQLDLAARRTAIRDAVRHGITTKLFINFTPSAIYDPTFCLRSTVQALDEAQIAPERVVFEIIESDHVAADYLRRICDYYRERGFSIALDDIGSGYSSLTLLNELRPDYMKLDMQLIRNIDHDGYKALITGKLLETAQGLGITTIAEGVETAAEYAWLIRHGADLIQGYYIAKPAASPPVPTLRPAAFA